MIGKSKAKVCFRCKKYIIIFPDNPISQKRENKFDNKHTGHTIQIICRDELDSKYKYERERFNKNVKTSKI
jgi:hypothetical protein